MKCMTDWEIISNLEWIDVRCQELKSGELCEHSGMERDRFKFVYSSLKSGELCEHSGMERDWFKFVYSSWLSANGFVPRAAISSSSRHVHKPQQYRHPECSPQYAVWQFLRVSTDSSSEALQVLEYHRQQLIPHLVKLVLRFPTKIAVENAEKRTLIIE